MGAVNQEEEEEGYKGYSVISLPNQLDAMKGKRNKPESGLFEDAGSCFIVVTHACLGKLTSLPFPVGPLMEIVEGVAVPIACPVEGFMLRLLVAIDALIYAAITTVERSMMSTSERVNHVRMLLLKRGLLGMSADFWVQYESSMRERLQGMIGLVNRIPLVAIATPFVWRVSAPLVNAMSNWLLEHSQSQDKTVQFHQSKEEEESDEMRMDFRDFERIDETAKDVIKEDEQTRLTDLKKGKKTKPMDMKKDEEKQAIDTEEDAKGAKVEKGVKEEEIIERKMEIPEKQNDASDVSAVLEMIDSGWLSPRTHAPPASPIKAAAPASNLKKHANSKSKRGGSRR